MAEKPDRGYFSGVPTYPRSTYRKGGLLRTIKNKLLSGDTPSAAAVKQRSKQVGAGISDIVAPSFYREVIVSQELVDAAPAIYQALALGRKRQEHGDHSQDVSPEQARTIAGAEGRELLELDI